MTTGVSIMMPTSCCGKLTFPYENEARAELARILTEKPWRDEIRVYKCKYGGWHLTSHDHYDRHDPTPAPGALILQPGRLVTCPWCGRQNILVAHGRVLSNHRDRRTLDSCDGVGRKVKYDEHGHVVKGGGN